MMIVIRLTFLSVLAFDCSVGWSQEVASKLPAASEAITASETHALLAYVRIPTKSLPKHVQLVECIRTPPLVPVAANPSTVVDPQAIKLIATHFGVVAEQELSAVRTAIVAIYQENNEANEIGVYGLTFSDEKAANSRFKTLAADEDDSPYFLKGTLLLYVWKDDSVSDEAFKAVQAYFREAEFKPDGESSAAELSLQLIELVTAGRNNGLGVATTYSVWTKVQQLLEASSVTEGFSVFETDGVPDYPDLRLKTRLLLPPLSERGGEFVARNEIRLLLTDAEVEAIAGGKRLVKALYIPTNVARPRHTDLTAHDLPDGMPQDEWLVSVRELGDLIAVFEFNDTSRAIDDRR